MQKYNLPDGKAAKFGMIMPGTENSGNALQGAFLQNKSASGGDPAGRDSGEDPVKTASLQLYNDVLTGNRRGIEKDTRVALDMGCQPEKLLNDCLMAAINEVGVKFDKGEYFLPQLIGSAEAMKMSIAVLEPALKKNAGDSQPKATIVFATVHGDVHDIGKNLVVLMLKNCGYNVIDLGKDVEAELIVDTAIREKAAVIGLSALMTTTMNEMKNVISLARKKKCSAKIIIGGACVTEDYAREIEADGYSSDAADCVKLLDHMLG
jgi:5-methyltetrahydrofolate--homocysteine methyltransferase